MAKDLRTLLEPAQTAGKGGKDGVPLAQRRSLTSPGEPRVFRVRAGFVCGLCGRLHGSLEPAFDCLSRCTIQLRLRTPVGRSTSGDQAHYACTACGRGYANTDDAEECFERCLVKMKPSPEFEKALRRVQVRYVQRLQNHGVRPLERIDPFTEHSKMLSALTQEQLALGRKVTASSQRQSEQHAPIAGAAQNIARSHVQAPTPNEAQTQPAMGGSIESAAPAGTNAPTAVQQASQHLPPSFEGLEHPTLSPPVVIEQGGPAMQEFGDSSPEPTDEDISASLMVDLGEVSSNEQILASVPKPTPETSDELSIAPPNVESLEASMDVSNDPASSEQHVNQTESLAAVLASSSAAPQLDLQTDNTTASANIENELDALLEQTLIEDPKEASESSPPSALSMLANATTPIGQSAKANLPATHNTNAAGFDDFPMDLMQDGSDALASALAEASEFAQVAEQPETNILAADVLALLQTSSSNEEVAMSKSHEKELSGKKINVDPDLLDRLTETDASDESLGKVFLRKPDMKTYRRNNAKYCCSACGKEFFTKEQVEACFYAHPEEGSEEARVLLERVKKSSARTAA